MAIKITALPAAGAAALTQLLEIVNDPSGTPVSQKATIQQVLDLIGNKSGAGSPAGVATPTYIGQHYTDTVFPYAVWTAVGLTNADWIQIY